jgi:hypothetical protein
MSTADYRDVVLDERTDANISLDKGDFVKCIDCGRLMLVNVGEGICPECCGDNLIWASDNKEEISEDFFNDNDKYTLVDMEL